MDNFYFDIETIPDQRPGALESSIADARENFKAPSTLTKEQAASDLGITDKDAVKFTSKDSMIAQWSERFGAERAVEVGELNWRKTSFDGAAGGVVVASFAINDEAPIALFDTNWQQSESKVIGDLFHAIRGLGELRSSRFIGHNHIAFDLRFLFHRAVILGIKPPVNLPVNARAWDDNVFDTMIAWSGTRDRISMNNLCAALGMPGKPDDIDGSKVWDFVRDGRIADVADYCKGDVERTRAIYKRLTFQAAA